MLSQSEGIAVMQGDVAVPPDVQALLDRSHALGRAPGVTNYAGGNTSCKAETTDPVTGEKLCVLWVKGSGGDLATLSVEGLAALTLDRILALRDLYAGADHEDEMVPLYEHCAFGADRAAPSIDTPLHALLPPAHLDHVHPDAVIALAASLDGEALVKECYGVEVAWIPWRRPGFELAVQLASAYRDLPALRGFVLGGDGLVSWGDTSEQCQATTIELVAQAVEFVAARASGKAAFGPRSSRTGPSHPTIAAAMQPPSGQSSVASVPMAGGSLAISPTRLLSLTSSRAPRRRVSRS